jgi:UDP-N-acetylmuramoyl-tripeptide--D-alanyl-D-alanine ligase
VIEVGIGAPGQMATYARMIRPNIAVVTSIGSEHNRSLPTLEVTRKEKSEMVKALPESGIAVLNGDDPNVLWMKNQTRARIMTFGMNETNDVRASDTTLDWPHGTRFKLHAGRETRDLHIRLIGKQMVYPILAAIAVALAEGFTLDQVVPAVQALPPTPGRLEPIQLQNEAFILRDDFKSQLETIEIALDTLSDIPANRRIVVLGDIEEPPKGKNQMYRQIGQRIGKVASCAIFIGGDSCRNYSRGARDTGMPYEEITHIRGNVLKAAELLLEKLKPGDVVLIKGRGAQRLGRVALSLMGRKVRCDIGYCNLRVYCENCSMLERGWKIL